MSATESISFLTYRPCGGQATVYSSIMPPSASFFSSDGFCAAVQFARFLEAGGEKRNPVEAVARPFVLEIDQQDFAHLRLPGLHCTLDLGGLEQRCVGVDRDLELAAGGLVDLGGELVAISVWKLAGG